ncbi:MAG: CpsD/CapB family tyrosine-protein kinase [Thermochromatium sp.]
MAEAYRLLCTQILTRMHAGSYQTLAITSPGRGDGKTTTALNLAIGLVRHTNQTVLLVDFDLKHPSIGRSFAPYDSPGIIDYLLGHAELKDVLIDPGLERLMILPSRTKPRGIPKRLSSLPLALGIAALRHHAADWLILFDMPPLCAGDAVVAVLPHIDAVLLVVDDGKVSGTHLDQAKALLGERCIGWVLNKARTGAGVLAYPE